MTDYKTNINDIPLDKHLMTGDQPSPSQYDSESVLPEPRDDGGALPAFNAGTIQFKCLINNRCPFFENKEHIEPLVFNQNTFTKEVMDKYPENLEDNITTTPGIDGISLRMRILYRHTFLAFSEEDNAVVGLPKITQDSNYVKYENEQTFIMTQNVFNFPWVNPWENNSYEDIDVDNLTEEEIEALCVAKTEWKYMVDTYPNTYQMSDAVNDYDKFWIDFYENLPNTQNNSNYSVWQPTRIMSPAQIATNNCAAGGLHWKMVKMTPMYKGEDFFVQFRKLNREDDIPNFETDSDKPKWKDSTYDFLNANLNNPNNNLGYIDDLDEGFPVNQGVVSYKKNKDGEYEVLNNKTYDLTDQAYYIIEIGVDDYSDESHRYFIIIPQKGNPRCVHVDVNGISWNLGEYTGGYYSNRSASDERKGGRSGGENLLSDDVLQVIVKHYLGSLVVYFVGTTVRSEPWVITRSDAVVENGELKMKRKNMYVPAEPIAIWGGNRGVSVNFGPIQYVSEFSFKHPPPPIQTEEGIALGSVNYSSTLSWPKRSLKNLYLRELNIPPDVENLISAYYPDYAPKDTPFYTQDAQYFLEWITKVKEINKTEKTYEIEYEGTESLVGNFFYKPPIKEFTDIPKESGETRDVANASSYDSWIGVEKISIIEESDETEVTIDDTQSSQYDQSDRYEKFSMYIWLHAGSHYFSKDREDDIDWESPAEWKNWLLWGCKTPIMTHVTLNAQQIPFARWGNTTGDIVVDSPLYADELSIDASPYVIDFKDSWSAQDFSHIEHTGNLELLLMDVVRKDSFVEDEDEIAEEQQTDIVQRLLSLRDRAFYVEIWAGYNDFNESITKDCDNLNYPRMPGLYKIFTGVCYGGQVSYSYGKRVMSCKLYDYCQVLKDQLFFNSPFFDGVKDTIAIHEILKLAGFADEFKYDPGKLVKDMLNKDDEIEEDNITLSDGRVSRYTRYVLPHGYNVLEQPQFKFPDASNLFDGINAIAQRAGKCFYFDQFGQAHYEDYFDVVLKSILEQPNDTMFDPRFWFTTNPGIYRGQLVFNTTEVTYAMEDVHNHIKILSNTPDYELLLLDDLNWDTLDNPDKKGFVGYLKTFYQADGMFGSMENARKLVNFYKTMFNPPLVVSFETYGQPIRALDIISLNGVPVRVMSVNNELDPLQNVWRQKIEGERFNAPDISVIEQEKKETQTA